MMLRRFLQYTIIVGILLGSESCVFCDTRGTLTLSGRLASQANGEARSDVFLGVRTFSDGTLTENKSPYSRFGTPRIPPPSSDGSFEIELSTGLSPCGSNPVFPAPDRVAIIVVDDVCWREISIDVNEESATFVENEVGVVESIELREPVIVPDGDEGCVNCMVRRGVRGVVLTDGTLEPVAGAEVEVRMQSEGDQTGTTLRTDPRNQPSAADGAFDVTVTTFIPCDENEEIIPPTDAMRVAVNLPDCQRRMTIEINEATATIVDDPERGFPVFELTDPILVTPCEQTLSQNRSTGATVGLSAGALRVLGRDLGR